MDEKKTLFSMLPKVDEILSRKDIIDILQNAPREVVLETIREEVDKLRNEIAKGNIDKIGLENRIDNLSKKIIKQVNKKLTHKFKRVINATGVIVHTNLGRSLIGEEVMEKVWEVATNYSNLEYDLNKGSRGSRYSHVEDIVKRITGAESALVVNNNAAAVMLVLSTLAKEKEVIVSRGELVEIGGSFRIPEVMEQSGAKLVEVGTTNKTHIWDYENAIGENTAALMKVHTSNYRIMGFSESVGLYDLVTLGKEKGLPVIEDLGSGILIDLSKYGLEYESTVQDSLRAGADIVTFSGDKLLGGPQAGIIVGKKEYIDRMKKNQLTRALRVDKFTLSALEATLRLYLDEEEAVNKIPTLKMITTSKEELESKAYKLFNILKNKVGEHLKLEVVDEFSQVGGGALPLEQIPTKAVKLYSDKISTSHIEKGLREQEIPIITRVYKEKIFIDVRTVKESEFDIIAYELEMLFNNI